MATLKFSSDLEKVIKKVVLDTYFPVGSLYLTVGSENPNNTIGGTWIKLSGYYLYADTSINNTSYTGKHTQNHTLTEDQMPNHGHDLVYGSKTSESGLVVSYVGSGYRSLSLENWAWVNSGVRQNIYARNTGGGQGHSHNIATKGIYVWQRTA